MAVEFVVAAPAFIVLLLLIGAGGQWVSASGEVGEAARDAARQASLEVAYASVQPGAQRAAQADLNNLCPGAARATVELLTNNVQVPAQAWTAGTGLSAQAVRITVECNVSLKAFAIIGIPASETFTDAATAPLDPFAPRTNG
jgi:Flp pilus assembly protein TadG